MNSIPAVRRRPSGDVQDDWVAWLPDEAAGEFERLRKELAVSCVILDVILNEALSFSSETSPEPSPELALLFAGLFDRLVVHLGAVLSALEEHGKACGTRPNAVPLRPEYFRSQQARQVARSQRILSRLPFQRSSAFRPKLGAIRQVMAGLQTQARNVVREIAAGESSGAHDRWACLEVLQYDLNTCLQETTVVLKSFFCALPGVELSLFRNRLPV